MTLRCLALLLTTVCAAAEPLTITGVTTVTLHSRAQVAGERLELGEIARITGDEAKALVALDMGPAPLPGGERTISLGYLKMRLRRWGLGEEQFVFEGPAEVTVSTAAVAAQPAVSAPTPIESEPIAPPPVMVKRGSTLRLQVTCGGVTILASATTLEDAAVGAIVKLRVDQTRQTTWALLDSPTLAILTR